ncbi:MAG: hypothetical protein LBF04_06505 [Prevotellaceae bacterium]|jgi:hypothetical protein|nr:hypothetical protein [Prevotellaceae bacterium]
MITTLSLGVDVAGMGRDSSVICYRYENIVDKFTVHQSGGVADHMFIAGLVGNELKRARSYAFIDTIGEGAGVYSRLKELNYFNALSCKVSESAKGYTDMTRQYQFANMRAYLYWCVRDWLNPKNNYNPCLPKNDKLLQEATEVKWKFQSDGKIIIEPKEELKKRIGRSPDYLDALANSFYPVKKQANLQRLAKLA